MGNGVCEVDDDNVLTYTIAVANDGPGHVVGAQVEDAFPVELMACGATHGYLPLLRTVPSAVRAQLKVAAASHRHTFGVAADGIWLPECGYYPGLDASLAEAGSPISAMARVTAIEARACSMILNGTSMAPLVAA